MDRLEATEAMYEAHGKVRAQACDDAWFAIKLWFWIIVAVAVLSVAAIQ